MDKKMAKILRCVGAMLCTFMIVASDAGAYQTRTSGAPAAGRPAAAAVTLVGLLNSAGLDYTRDKDGIFKVVVSVEGEATLVYASEASLGDSSNPDYKLVRLYCLVVLVPKGFKHPSAMRKKIGELNDNLLVGKVSIDQENGHVWYNSSFWLRTATPATISNELYLGHYLRAELRKELLPFVKE